MTVIDDYSHISIYDTLKRPQESTYLSKVEGRFILSKAQNLKEHSVVFIFKILI